MQEEIHTNEDYEDIHVHQVYEKIAPHFSSTRYKPWPIVERFLKNLSPGSVGLDVGCGNGKYLGVNSNIFIVATDRSESLVRIAAEKAIGYGRERNTVKSEDATQKMSNRADSRSQILRHAGNSHDVGVADSLTLPHPKGKFDFAISIAVIHHFSTPNRRVDAVAALLETLKPASAESIDAGSLSNRESGSNAKDGGKALIFVWALEQKTSRRGWDKDHEQDVMVPWVMQQGSKPTGATTEKQASESETASREGAEDGTASGEKTYYRYYHLYREGELESDIRAAGGDILESGYERDNWWAIATRQPQQ